jgi:hypothetical protein
MFLSDPREKEITFGTPGNNEPFTFSMRDMFKVDDATLDGINKLNNPDWGDVNKMGEKFGAGVLAAERQTRLVDTVNARENALFEAAEHRIRTVQERTGIQLENPFRGGYAMEAQERLGVPLTGASPIDLNRIPAAQRDIFNEKMDEVARNFPDNAAALNFGQSLEDQAAAIAKSAAYDGEHADGGFIAAVAGGLWGSRRDPLFLGSLFVGPGTSVAKTALGKIGWGAIKQGLFNAGLQAAAQPAVQEWRREIGEKNGVVPALENVGMAFVFGAIPGAAIEGFHVWKAGQKEALKRIGAGTATPDDVRTVGDALGVKIDDAADRQIRTAAADAANDADAIGEPPPGIAPDQHADLTAQAVRHAEDPATNPPPEIPIVTPARAPDQVRVLDETRPAAPGDRQMVDGKPVTFERFNPQDLATDAVAFQYKGGGDAAGVTDRLKHVTAFDPLASGKTLVFERADGTRVIADGHQRLGLAKRLGETDTSVKLDGFTFREKDGWTAEDVRAIAAKKNMQEGSGDALDAARVLRDRPDLLDGSLPVSSPMMKNAIALSRLSDEAFGMAINGMVPPNYAAAVGSMVPDRLQHAGVLSDLVRFAPDTEREARVLIGEIMAAGFRPEEQISLFGATTATRSLMGERVKVLDAALTGLAKDKRLFGTLAEKADAIEAAGNQLARGSNDARAQDAAQLQDMLTRLARRTGPVSDALNRAAAQMAEGMKPAKAAEGFLDDVRTLLDRDGLNGLLASPELKPARAVEPGTPEALASAETAAATRTEITSPEAPQGHGGASQATGFTTAKGSKYVVHEDGTTTRDKAARSDAGHEGDSGLKPRTAKTIYVDADKASALSGAGISGANEKGFRVIITDGKASLLSWNEAADKWGISPSSRDIPFTTTPEVGKAPVELWKPATDVSGHEAYRGQHAGNAITEVTLPAPKEPSLFDSIAVAGRDDGRDVRFISREAALAEAGKPSEHADLVASCKG